MVVKKMNNMNKEGWICPRCGKVNAPWLPQCFCDSNFNIEAIKQQNETFGVGKEVVKNDNAFTDNEQKMIATCNEASFTDLVKNGMRANTQVDEHLRSKYE